MGFPQRFCGWVFSYVRAPRFSILVNGQLTESIVAGCGFRQGCPLSPYLFIICSELLSLHFHQNFPELGATIPNVRKVLSILGDHCGWTGQKINKNKSVILFSKTTASSTKSRLARLAGCHMVEEMEYFGIKLAMRRLRKVDFSPLLQKIRSHTLSWGVLTEIEKICRSFLWDRDAEHKSLHYASWRSLARPRRVGGLGFHDSSNWTGPLREHKRGHSAGWKVICSEVESLEGCVRWRICTGSDVDVLNHVWILDIALSRWPTFCNVEMPQDCTVDEFITGERNWNKPKLLIFFGEALADRICDVKIWTELVVDTLELIKCPLGSSVSAICYNNAFQEVEDPCCPILKIGLRPRVRIFWWRVSKDLIPTGAWLARRGLSSDMACPLGFNQEENRDHITTRCMRLMEVLGWLANWGFNTPRFSSFAELQLALGGALRRPRTAGRFSIAGLSSNAGVQGT
ncbi:uncharacterized protein LOC110113476 [Dendrobium catenatum]|uniref:uncharacterized protein LOC110113476 n=1 Tax=Dendrobium catenatum TaxID=906689 RepID=UPI0009F71CF7|nr:uncharacterized protein LOC110113476 [Dendrobium catenatum]